MKLRWIIVVTSCVALFLGSLIVWRFIRSKLNDRQLAKDAVACRIRAEQGDAEAQFKLGSMYSKGKGVPKDYVEALRWYRKSAEQGYAKAEYNLSYMYRDGKGVSQDYVEAAGWCRKAAEQGDPRAQEGLGYLYYRGEGVPQSHAEALRWYRKSAEQGYGDAEYDLGYMYYYGYGVPQDRVEANRLFHQAAAHGSTNAQRTLGWNQAHISMSNKVFLFLQFLVSLVFGAASLPSREGHRTRVQIVIGIAALLIISSIGLDVLWYFYSGHLQSLTAATALYSVRHLVRGAIVGVLAFAVYPKSARTLLIASVVLFIAFILFQVALPEIRHIPLSIRRLSFAGFFIGMSIPSIVFLRLDTGGTGLNGKDGGCSIAGSQ